MQFDNASRSTPVGEAYARFYAWRSEHMPWLSQPGGAAIFFLLASAQAGKPLHTSDLYRKAGVSPSKVLATIDEFRRKDLIALSVDPRDKRRRQVEATDLLRQLARRYLQAVMGHLL